MRYLAHAFDMIDIIGFATYANTGHAWYQGTSHIMGQLRPITPLYAGHIHAPR